MGFNSGFKGLSTTL